MIRINLIEKDLKEKEQKKKERIEWWISFSLKALLVVLTLFLVKVYMIVGTKYVLASIKTSLITAISIGGLYFVYKKLKGKKGTIMPNLSKVSRPCFYFFSVSLIISILLALLLGIAFARLASVQIPGYTTILLIFCAIVTIFLIKRWEETPYKQEWIVELFGDYYDTWKAGPHIRFPFMRIRNKVPMGDFTILLKLDSKIKGYGGGDVECSDCQVKINASLLVHIEDSKKATYETSDIVENTRYQIESAIRIFFGPQKLEDIVGKGADFNLNSVTEKIELEDTNDKKIKLLDYLKNHWGEFLISLNFNDIILSEKVATAREGVVIAEKKKEAAAHDAEAKKRLQEVLGSITKEQLKQIISEKLSPQEAASLLEALKKWEALANSERAVIIPEHTNNLIPVIGLDGKTTKTTVAATTK